MGILPLVDVVMPNDSSPNAFLPSALIDPDRIAASLGALAARIDVVAIKECASTNTVLIDDLALWRLRHSVGISGGRRVFPADPTPLPNGASTAASDRHVVEPALLLVADMQTAGRGRRGRSWVSSPADSLTFSLRWHFARGTDLSGLSLVVGLAVRKGLLNVGQTGIALKWPNDLLVETAQEGGQFAKLGGVLIELSTGRENLTAVIGVGINLRAPNVDDLAQPRQPVAGLDAPRGDAIGRPVVAERHNVLAGLLTELVKALDSFAEAGFAPFQCDWNAADGFAGREIVLADEGVVCDFGICLGVDVDGALRVRTARGDTRWLAGDVSLRLRDSDAP